MARLHSTLALLALTSAVALPGCNSFGGKQANSGTPGSRARSDLKNPSAVFLAYGRMQERQGLLAEARESYGFVLKEEPESRDAMLGLARLDQLAGRATEAEQRYQQIAQVHPNDPAVLEAVGQFHATQERWQEAVPLLRQAADLVPDQPATRYNLAIALAHTGAVEAARREFQSTVGVAAAHYNLGHILMDDGNLRAAESELIAAIDANPDLEEAQALLGELRGQAGPDYQLAGADSQRDSTRTEHALAKRAVPERAVPAHHQPARRVATRPIRDEHTVRSWTPGDRPASPRGDEQSRLTAAQREQLGNQSGF